MRNWSYLLNFSLAILIFVFVILQYFQSTFGVAGNRVFAIIYLLFSLLLLKTKDKSILLITFASVISFLLYSSFNYVVLDGSFINLSLLRSPVKCLRYMVLYDFIYVFPVLLLGYSLFQKEQRDILHIFLFRSRSDKKIGETDRATD